MTAKSRKRKRQGGDTSTPKVSPPPPYQRNVGRTAWEKTLDAYHEIRKNESTEK